jgi:hypothetical protein
MTVNKHRFQYSGPDPLVTAPCVTCRHKSTFGPSCDAFPGGIPEEILDGRNQHREPVEGDHDIQYEEA